MSSLHLRNATLDGGLCDVRIVDGLIAAITPAGASPDEPASVDGIAAYDLGGRALLPSLVNGHAHLDKTFLGFAWHPYRSGDTVRERVAAERALRSHVDAPIRDRAETLARLMVEAGTTLIRSHVDIDAELGLDALDALVEVRERMRPLVELQIVAFPQSGILSEPGVADLLAEALTRGADVVGGLDPEGFDGDAVRHLDTVFALAVEHGASVDVHLHELGEPGIRQMGMMADRTRDAGLAGRSVISHAYGLGSVSLAEALRIGERIADAGMSVMTNGPAGPMPPVLALRDIGVNVFSGSDNIRDAWWPYGTPDMLDIARTVAYQSNFRLDAELEVAVDLVTTSAARALGVHDHVVRVGAPADLVVFDCRTVQEALVSTPARWLVLKRGSRVAGIAPAPAHSPAPVASEPYAYSDRITPGTTSPHPKENVPQ